MICPICGKGPDKWDHMLGKCPVLFKRDATPSGNLTTPGGNLTKEKGNLTKQKRYKAKNSEKVKAYQKAYMKKRRGE